MLERANSTATAGVNFEQGVKKNAKQRLCITIWEDENLVLNTTNRKYDNFICVCVWTTFDVMIWFVACIIIDTCSVNHWRYEERVQYSVNNLWEISQEIILKGEFRMRKALVIEYEWKCAEVSLYCAGCVWDWCQCCWLLIILKPSSTPPPWLTITRCADTR